MQASQTPRPRPRRRALMAVALAAPLLLAFSQLRLLPQDQGVLLVVAGTPMDLSGRLQSGWQALVRDCSAVQHLHAGSVAWMQAQQALAAHSPPASRGARPLQLLLHAKTDGDWLLAEVLWDGVGGLPAGAPLDPAIVPIRRGSAGLQVLTEGVWSGDTGPWAAPAFIRRWPNSPARKRSRTSRACRCTRAPSGIIAKLACASKSCISIFWRIKD